MYVLTIYRTTETLLIQGNTWVNNEYPISKAVMKEEEKRNIEIGQACNKILA